MNFLPQGLLAYTNMRYYIPQIGICTFMLVSFVLLHRSLWQKVLDHEQI